MYDEAGIQLKNYIADGITTAMGGPSGGYRLDPGVRTVRNEICPSLGHTPAEEHRALVLYTQCN
jgi:hypothetical protein